MKLTYDPTADMLHISFGARVEVESFPLCDGVLVRLDPTSDVAAIQIEGASERVDIQELQAAVRGRERSRPGLKDLLLAPEPRWEPLTPPRS